MEKQEYLKRFSNEFSIKSGLSEEYGMRQAIRIYNFKKDNGGVFKWPEMDAREEIETSK